MNSDIAAGLAVAEFLRSRHPVHTAGHVAQRLRCTKKAAENVLDGHLSAKVMTTLARAYGWSLIIGMGAVMSGCSEDEMLRTLVDAEIKRIAGPLARQTLAQPLP